jgi:hypothetical protein
MDLNYLLHRHQVSLMRAKAALCVPSRRAHEELANLYAGAVSRNQTLSGGLLSVGGQMEAHAGE